MATPATQPFQWTNELVQEFAIICAADNGGTPFNEEQRQQLMQEFIDAKTASWQVLKIKGEASDWYYTLVDGVWRSQKQNIGIMYDFKKQGMRKGYLIWSVQRLPDKEVFTVGDTCLQGTIKSISVDGAMCCICFGNKTVLIEHVKKLLVNLVEMALMTTQQDAIVKYNNIVEFAKIVQLHSVAPGDLAYSVLGLTAEAGEVGNVVKKLELNIMHPEWVTGESGLKSTEELEHDLLEELGDTLFYAFRIMLDQRITIWDVIDCQARKLNHQSEKYGRTFLK